jgi:hypothetical protein
MMHQLMSRAFVEPACLILPSAQMVRNSKNAVFVRQACISGFNVTFTANFAPNAEAACCVRQGRAERPEEADLVLNKIKGCFAVILGALTQCPRGGEAASVRVLPV